MEPVTRLARAVIRQALQDITTPRLSRDLRERAYAWLTSDSPDLHWWMQLAGGLRFNASMVKQHPLEYFATVRLPDLSAEDRPEDARQADAEDGQPAAA